MDLEKADQLALRSVPGIGPELARRLVAARDAGRLSSWDEVRRVRGMGPQRIRTLQQYADIAPAPAQRFSPASR